MKHIPAKSPPKQGRNELCDCDSGLKYKKCHGKILQENSSPLSIPEHVIRQSLAELKAKENRRKALQGHGRPIISIMSHGYRMVAVRNKLHWSKTWRTFHDFLFSYVGILMEPYIGNEDLKRKRENQHPISRLYQDCCAYQKEMIVNPGHIHDISMTDFVWKYMWLGYNLYLMEHHGKLLDAMLKRLAERNLFEGAYFETEVIRIFILAGFDIELEDEEDISKSHVEFTATHKATGERFSVEAKTRLAGKSHANINRQLLKALRKDAPHPRVVFVDLNFSEPGTDYESLQWPREVNREIRELEEKLLVKGSPAPPAYIFVTNGSASGADQNSRIGKLGFATGFKIPDFGTGKLMTLRQLIEAREKHAPMHDLMKSMQEFGNIPATFDGEVPAFSFNDVSRRFVIGLPYRHSRLIDGQNVIREIIITDAVVSKETKTAYLVLQNGDIVQETLSDLEVSAYEAHPDTFFGVDKSVPKGLNDILDMYDFFYSGYRETPKERLLELLKSASNPLFTGEPQEKLASIYAERMANSVWSRNHSDQ
ncbi:MAG: SEC-C domain-containing protein [Gammaproteobacteria bacterium]|nr:SEC-C domain-containing protein [Gammaproteobacteria bacterium]